MSMTDPIADFLARIRNGISARKQLIECFVEGVIAQEDTRQGMLKLTLKYDGRGSGCAISGMRRVSRPGQRAYVPAKQVPKVRNGLGIAILSTSQGVMTDREARHKGVGGEVICEIW
jgi:small subunit ribosomal protein S8